MEQITKDKEGWGCPYLSKKAHFFVGTTSLCGQWYFNGPIEKGPLGDKPGRDDCVACWRKQHLRERAA